MKNIRLAFFLFMISIVTYAQTMDSIQRLDEVVLSDVKLKRYASGFKVTVLSDSLLEKNNGSFTDLLRFNSTMYFKENGYGMVSSPSFRGTNASQTAVVWNGISINSQLTGQTDFNTINTSNFDRITIRSGGGSVQYGSGAIGGSIHLNNSLDFNTHFTNDAMLSYGSFDTKSIRYLTSIGHEKLSANIGLHYIVSDNDYKYRNTDARNENGAYNNKGVNVTLGYILSDKNVIKLYHQTFFGEREFSGTIASPSLAKYDDKNFRTMVEWSHHGDTFRSRLKLAHLQEHFKYFGNKNTDNYSFGKVNTYILNYTTDIKLSEHLELKPILAFNYYEGRGSSFDNPNRNAFSATTLLLYKPNQSWRYGLNLRQDITSDFESPLLFSFDVAYQVSKMYTLKLNGSKNFRVPTFNDLYWQPGGHLNIKPETSYQIDFGHDISLKTVSLLLNAFFIKTSNLIQWQPSVSGIWSPQNVNATQNYGAEANLEVIQNVNDHKFSFGLNYAYTVSEDTHTNKQLIYVPFHKANASLAYSFKAVHMFFQHTYTGEVFTTTDNIIGPFNSVDAFHLSNFGFNYKVLTRKTQQIDLGLRVNNVFNTEYESVLFRPMPNRNFNIQIHYKF